MRDTVWNGERQSMIIEEDYFVYVKKQIHALICVVNQRESNGYLLKEPDFLSQHGQIQQEIESRGHK
ncbi:30400_t:CDS:2, partial [Gigaspora margarita]